MFGFADTQRQIQDLLLETRSYVGLQKKAIIAETRDKLSAVLSQLAIAVVCLLLGSMVLLFLAFFLAYVIGQALGSIALGFACVTAFVLLLLLIFWHWRALWIVRPVTNMMTRAFTVGEKPVETGQVAEELKESRTRMSGNFQQLMGNSKRPSSRVEQVSSWMGRGFAIYEGVRIGLSVMRAFSNVFGRKRRRRR